MDLAKRKEELAAELDKANRAIEQATLTAYRLQGALAICDEIIAAEQPVVNEEGDNKGEP